MDETFEIQTIGRIRRMPEAKHYENDLLDSCYLYTLDEKRTLRQSHNNPDVQAVYANFLEKPLSHLAEELLHSDHVKEKNYK